MTGGQVLAVGCCDRAEEGSVPSAAAAQSSPEGCASDRSLACYPFDFGRGFVLFCFTQRTERGALFGHWSDRFPFQFIPARQLALSPLSTSASRVSDRLKQREPSCLPGTVSLRSARHAVPRPVSRSSFVPPPPLSGLCPVSPPYAAREAASSHQVSSNHSTACNAHHAEQRIVHSTTDHRPVLHSPPRQRRDTLCAQHV